MISAFLDIETSWERTITIVGIYRSGEGTTQLIAPQIERGLLLQALEGVDRLFTYNGTGTGAINGLVISQNVQDASATTIDSTTIGNSAIALNCENVQGGGFLPKGWFVKSGSYFEPHD